MAYGCCSAGIDFRWSTFRQFNSKIQWSLFFRSFFGCLAITGQVLSVELMPLSVAVSIMMMTVFTTAILAWIILGDALTPCEIFTIIMGTFGMFMFCSANIFAAETDEAMLQRDAADARAYPYYTVGVLVAVSVTFWMAFEFIAMSNLGGFVHSSWKTFTLGFMSTVLSFVYLLFVDPKFFYGWAIGDSPITWM